MEAPLARPRLQSEAVTVRAEGVQGYGLKNPNSQRPCTGPREDSLLVKRGQQGKLPN